MTLRLNASLFIVFVAVAMFFIASCAPQPASVMPAPAETEPASQSIQYGTKTLTILHPQSPDTLNIYLTNSVKDFEPSRIVYEPLAVFDKDGELIPVLAQEIPSFENGLLAEDGRSVTWKLKRDIRWSDGTPFTADDVVFTYLYIMDESVGVVKATRDNYALVKDVEKVDDFTVRVNFTEINPAWYVPFVGTRGVIIPRHIFLNYKNATAKDAPANKKPVGTGPYVVVTDPGIKPQEVLLLGSNIVQTTKIVFERNPYYRTPDMIAFDRIIWRGGGTVSEAARLSLQVGSVDVAYDLDQVDTDELAELLEDGKGTLVTVFAPGVERLLLNQTDPIRVTVDQESSSLSIPHPLFSDLAVRQAVAYAVDRDSIAELYGANGVPAYAVLVSPPQYHSSNVFYKYDPETANALLDEAGYLDTDGDTFREKNGVNMKVVFQALVGAIPQRAQQIVQRNLDEIGIDVEIRFRDSSQMFDPSHPDSAARFNVDLLMFRTRSGSPDPTAFMSNWVCAAIPQKENNWQAGNNNERWCNEAYDELLAQVKTELDPAKREQIFQRLNDMLVEDVAVIPLVWRASALGVNKNLVGVNPTPWDAATWNIAEWQFVE
jgi:peptide/nickel transport system substrate-binding protein